MLKNFNSLLERPISVESSIKWKDAIIFQVSERFQNNMYSKLKEYQN